MNVIGCYIGGYIFLLVNCADSTAGAIEAEPKIVTLCAISSLAASPLSFRGFTYKPRYNLVLCMFLGCLE